MVWILFLILSGTVGIALIRKHFEKRRHLYSQLFCQWQNARLKRQKWLSEHHYGNPFTSREYGELWEIEIGAEAILNITFPCTHDLSWKDFKYERS